MRHHYGSRGWNSGIRERHGEFSELRNRSYCGVDLQPLNNSGKKVLLVSANRERQPYPVVPNGLACVASALEQAGHEVRFVDLCFARNPIDTVRRAAREFVPDVAGVSV